MTFRKLFSFAALTILALAIMQGQVSAQGRATLRGSVNDEVGAVIVGAVVTLTNSTGAAKTATSNADGAYTFTGLAPGKYTLHAEAAGFSASEDVEVDVTTARREPVTITLKVATIESEVKVEANTPISTDSASNANQQVLSGKDLDALPDDPDELAAALQALAGPSIGPGGGQIFIDGFSGASLPPRQSIREIRINQNPFAAENDQPSGRIDILTKPGTDKFRGSLSINFTDESLNSRNPFAISSAKRSPFQVRQYSGSLSGPLVKNKASFFLEVNRNETDDNELIRATVLDPAFNITQVGLGFLLPRRNTNFSPRIEYAINDRNTLIARYNYNRNETQNNGVGGFSLPSRGFNTISTNQNLQLTETAVINATTINETRFQFSRGRNENLGNSSIPVLNVSGAFIDGGSQVGHAINERQSWELNNFTQMQRGMHTYKFGARVRGVRIDDISPNNFGGQWVFTGGFGPQFDGSNNPVAGTNVPLSSIERYRRTALIQSTGLTAAQQAYCGAGVSVTQCIRTLGGGANQFSINQGNPEAEVSQVDVGFYWQDDWRIRPNLTLSYGLRYENQTNANSKFNFAPRFGFAWSPGGGANSTKPPKTVVRGGIGVFFNRFNEGQTLITHRFNGVEQLQYVITDPSVILGQPPTPAQQAANPSFTLLNSFPTVPSVAAVPASQQTIWRVAPNLQAPTFYLTGLQVERQLPRNMTMFMGVYTLRIKHAIRARDLNAPLPPTFASRPNPADLCAQYWQSPTNAPCALGDVYQYESSGNFRQSQMFIGFNSRLNPKLSISGNYSMSKSENDTDGQGGSLFPMNSYDFRGEFGRSSFDIRHRFTLFGTINSPWWKIVFNPFVVANSGPPFNITTGSDLNLDRQSNERPTFAQLNAYCTTFPSRCTGFDYSSTSSDFVPRNYGNGPGSVTFNLRASRTWTFGGETARASSQGGGNRGGRGGAARGGPSLPSGGASAGARGPAGGGPVIVSGPQGGGGGAAGRYSLTLSLNVQNLFNHVNLGTPVGNLSSSNFGQSLGLAGSFGGFGGGGGGSTGAGNRRLYVNVRFNF
jgi:hypothetical protein